MTLAPAALADAAPAYARRADWAPSLAALLLFVIPLFSPATLNDGDTFWHIAAGDWMLAHRAIPTADPFTFSRAGAPWAAHEWLSEVLFALSYRLGGWNGVMILAATAAAATAYFLVERLQRDLQGPALAIVATLGLSLLLGSLLARPHILALPVFAAWAAGLFAARDSGRAPSLALLPLMTLWVNLHGSFVFGLALLAPLALEAVIEAPGGKARRNRARLDPVRPAGGRRRPDQSPRRRGADLSLQADGHEKPVRRRRMAPGILRPRSGRWKSLCSPWSASRSIARSGSGPCGLTLLIVLIHLALRHTRHGMVLGLVGPMILAGPIARALGEAAVGPLRLTRAQGAGLAALFIALAGIRLVVPLERRDDPTAPVSALAAVPAQPARRAGPQ